jgi:DNA-binding PadR family transcriptional regulator
MMKQFFEHAHRAHDEGHRHFRHAFGHGFGRDFGRGMGGWGGRARRGDVKFLVLEVLAEGPRHGYEIIRAIEERRGFRPSPGSIYPTLQMLEDGGFVTSAEVDGKRVYTIAESGRELLANRTADPDADSEDAPDPRRQLWMSMGKLARAAASARDSDEATLTRVRTILDRARKEIYGILATDEA